MGSPDLYDAVDLNYWSNAESTVTIIAASIPILRVLVKDVTKSMLSREQYYGSTPDTTARTKISTKLSSRLERENRATVTGGTNRPRPSSRDTDDSELDILSKDTSLPKAGAIVQTNHYTVEYEQPDWKGERSDSDGPHNALKPQRHKLSCQCSSNCFYCYLSTASVFRECAAPNEKYGINDIRRTDTAFK
ncbi:hypothetical protein V8F33_009546 [Rhypophila sp. PSN 637]